MPDNEVDSSELFNGIHQYLQYVDVVCVDSKHREVGHQKE